MGGKEKSTQESTHPHRRASSPSCGPPHAILRLRQNAHATGVPRLYGLFADVVPGTICTDAFPPGSADRASLRPVVGE